MSKAKIIIISLCTVIALTAVCFFIYITYGPNPSAKYYEKIISRLGTPAGYMIDPARTELRDGGLGGSPYARQAFEGPKATDETRIALAAKLKEIGFKNVSYSSPSGLPGVFASCKNTAVFARLNQKGDHPIDIEVFSTHFPGSNSFCPWLF
jgi:hypothetical protein